MSKDKRTILLIENQWAEFDKICDVITSSDEDMIRNRLNKNYEVILGVSEENGSIYKKQDDKVKKQYKQFADFIRIYANKQYDSKYQKQALEKLKLLYDKVELVIMDHIIGGAYGCKTGIDLAEDFAKNDTNNYKPFNDLKPILFLSKTEHTDKERVESYDKYIDIIKNAMDSTLSEEEKRKKIENHTNWIHKGFFGDEILQDNYIQKEVILKERGVEDLLEKSKRQKLITILTEWNTSTVPNCDTIKSAIKNLLKKLNSEKNINPEIENYILETTLIDNNIATLDINILKDNQK